MVYNAENYFVRHPYSRNSRICGRDFHLHFYLSSTSVYALSQFLLLILPSSPFGIARSHAFI
jgi:hypothetical protein